MEMVEEEKGGKELSDLKVGPPQSSSLSVGRCSISEYKPVKKLFINFNYGCTAPTVYWYMIDPDNSRNSTLLTPVCTIPYPEIRRSNASVALGSKIFMIGGITRGDRKDPNYEGSSDVFSFDTNTGNGNGNFEWRKEDGHLLAKRCDSALVATHGQIYVFGSNFLNPEPWAEVFDPNFNTSSSLPHPPQEATVRTGAILSAVVANGDEIFLYQTNCLVCFNVKNRYWSQISTALYIPKRWGTRNPIVDDVMFTYYLGDVFAYDFAEQKWFESPVEGLGIVSKSVLPLSELDDGRVLHLGNGKFIVLWYDWYDNFEDTEDSEQICIRCLTFRLTKVTNLERGSYLLADVQTQSNYIIATGVLFGDCLAL